MAYEDLLKDSSYPLDNKNYFNLTITDLNINTTYPIQFRWKYNDGTFGSWSGVKTITTPGESTPATPSTLTVTGGAGILTVTWNGNSATGSPMTNIDRLDIYIDGAPFDASKPADSLFSAGTKTIAAPAGTYIVAAYAVSKAGTKSAVNTPVTRTVTAVGEIIQSPSLPTGLTAVSAPFSVSINWDGTYSSSTFTGFKSIDIYAVSTDLGSTTTSGISNTNLVGSLTVNDTPNKVNIGLDNLRQALSLASNAAAYTATIFFYYIAVNKDNTKYGSPTYTRINSTSVAPTQANYVDLANGVISVENLVAGNGNFSSWLRTGSAGGARIELSSVSDFSNGGYTVQKGLVAYSSGNTELFNLDLDAATLTINGSGTFTGNLSIGSSNAIFKAQPSTGIWLGDATYASAPFSVSTNGVIKANSGTIGGWTLASSYLQNSAGTFQMNSANSTIYIGSYATSDHIRISASGGIQHTNSGGSATGKFTLDPGGSLTISGNVTATAGYFGSSTNNWLIGSDGITAVGSARIRLGNYDIKSLDGTDFTIYDYLNSQTILTTNAVGSISRIYLGQSGRQVEVAKSAEISGTYSEIEQDYRSGGLRNMFTVTTSEYARVGSSIFPDLGGTRSCPNGSVLLVYTP